MKKSFKYRIYPNIIQSLALDHIFYFCRFLYNSALQERISFYNKYKKTISYNVQAAELLNVKEHFKEETKNIHSQILQQTLKQLEVAFKNFFRRIKQGEKSPGFPRFKGKDRFKSICFPQVAEQLEKMKGIQLINSKLKVYGISGEIKTVIHRPFQGKVKQARITKSSSGKYYLVLSCDEVAKQPLHKTNKVIGIDLGLTSFITTDDGIKFHHPKPYKTSKEKLAYLQRKLAAKQRASNNRRKVKVQIAKQSERITNIREDYQHKVANKLIKENDQIIVEKLNIESMMEQKGLAVSKSNITDASWGNFVSKLLYKAESAGKTIIQVDPRNTSKMCSGCGNIKEDLRLQNRTYDCQACSLTIDRDINAAINIKRLGINLAISS